MHLLQVLVTAADRLSLLNLTIPSQMTFKTKNRRNTCRLSNIRHHTEICTITDTVCHWFKFRLLHQESQRVSRHRRRYPLTPEGKLVSRTSGLRTQLAWPNGRETRFQL